VKTFDLDSLHLLTGGHDSVDDGVCLLEAVAWFAGEPHSDHPACTSPVLGAFGRRLNDLLPDDRRQELVPLVPQLVGTAGDGLDETRRAMCVDHALRVAAPRWLDEAGMTDQAAQLRALAPITNLEEIRAARPLAWKIRDEAWAGRQSLWHTVYEAVRAKFVGGVAAAAAAVAAVDAVVAVADAAVAADAAAAAADAAAAAAAAAAADAVDAAAAAVAVAVAVDAAAAAAAADAAAAAAVAVDAAAVADAAVAVDAAAVAVAVAARLRRANIREAVYKAVRAAMLDRFGPLIKTSQDEAIDLFTRMIRPTP